MGRDGTGRAGTGRERTGRAGPGRPDKHPSNTGCIAIAIQPSLADTPPTPGVSRLLYRWRALDMWPRLVADARAVDKRAVEAAVVENPMARWLRDQNSVTSGDGAVVET